MPSSSQQLRQQGQMTSPKQSENKATEGIKVTVVSMGLHMKDMSPVISFRERLSAPASIKRTNKDK